MREQARDERLGEGEFVTSEGPLWPDEGGGGRGEEGEEGAGHCGGAGDVEVEDGVGGGLVFREGGVREEGCHVVVVLCCVGKR